MVRTTDRMGKVICATIHPMTLTQTLEIIESHGNLSPGTKTLLADLQDKHLESTELDPNDTKAVVKFLKKVRKISESPKGSLLDDVQDCLELCYGMEKWLEDVD